MQTTEYVKRRIANAEDLLSIVRTMKALAAVNIRQFEDAVESLGDYHRTVELGFQAALKAPATRLTPPRVVHANRLGAIIIGSDQGMCGQFNEQIATYALRELDRMPVPPGGRVLLAMGVRLIAHLEAAEVPIAATLPISGSVAGISPMVQDILLIVDSWRAEQDVDQVYVFYNGPISAAAYRPQMMQLLPFDLTRFRGLWQEPWPSRGLPIFTMDGPALLSALTRQYLFVSVFRTLAESLVSENASRLATMQSAERNIQEHLETLNNQYHQQRQRAITEEILDIIAGVEALG